MPPSPLLQTDPSTASLLLENAPQIIGAIGTVVGAVLGANGLRRFRKAKEIVEGEKNMALAALNKTLRDMESQCREHEGREDEYVTLEYLHPDGKEIFVPIFPNLWQDVFPGISMMLMDKNKDRTICALRIAWAQELPVHYHHRVEEIYVLSGSVIQMEEGKPVRTYGPRETWIINAEEHHCAVFKNAILNITYVPALPTALERPANLENAQYALSHIE